MKHHSKKVTLGRVKRQRDALMRSLTRSLILKGGIVTTVAKAKAVRPFVERLITHSKTDTVAKKRLVASRIGNDTAVLSELYKNLASKYKDRAGGYTRITKLGKVGARSAESARIELV